MNNISFALTTQQVRDSIPLVMAGEEPLKSVTRRTGWLKLKVGDRLQACEKCMGRRKGEPLVKIVVIQVVDVRRERLDTLTKMKLMDGLAEVRREGFMWTPQQFVQFFCQSHKRCTPETVVTRIAFEYLPYTCDNCGKAAGEPVAGRALPPCQCGVDIGYSSPADRNHNPRLTAQEAVTAIRKQFGSVGLELLKY